MKTTRILTALTAFLLIFSLAACGTSKDNKKEAGNKKAEIAALIAMEPGARDEAADLHKKLMAQENAILSENSTLWEKVFLSANKGMPKPCAYSSTRLITPVCVTYSPPFFLLSGLK